MAGLFTIDSPDFKLLEFQITLLLLRTLIIYRVIQRFSHHLKRLEQIDGLDMSLPIGRCGRFYLLGAELILHLFLCATEVVGFVKTWQLENHGLVMRVNPTNFIFILTIE